MYCPSLAACKIEIKKKQVTLLSCTFVPVQVPKQMAYLQVKFTMQNGRYPFVEILIVLVLALVIYFSQSPFPANIEHKSCSGSKSSGKQSKHRLVILYMMIFYFSLVNPGLTSVL